jgi:hypothetical protein
MNRNQTHWLVAIFVLQAIFAAILFPVISESHDSDVYWRIQNDEVRRAVIAYHRKNQGVAWNVLLAFAGLGLASCATFYYSERLKK